MAIKILCDNKKRGIYNIGSGEAINLKKIAEIIARKFKKTILFLRDNKPTYLVSDSSKLKNLVGDHKNSKIGLIIFTNMQNISIIIPTYKEKENIFKLTKKILNLFPHSTIFVIDDTKDLNLKNKFKSNKIKYFLRKNKRGRGSAVIYGLKKSLKNKSNNIFIEMDADFSHNPNELKKNKIF